jgi:hypothetical protein
LLKELRHSVKQKNPNTEKRIKTSAKNKARSRLANVRPPWPSASVHSRNKPGFDQKPNSESADDTEDGEEELIKPICENLRNLRIKENWKQPAWPSGHPLLAMSNTLAFFDLSRQALLC